MLDQTIIRYYVESKVTMDDIQFNTIYNDVYNEYEQYKQQYEFDDDNYIYAILILIRIDDTSKYITELKRQLTLKSDLVLL